MSESEGASPHYLGHRERLRDKLLDNGTEALADYEILELLLASAIPRRDVKPIAKALLAKFGNFAKVMHASVAELCTVEGIGRTAAGIIKAVEASTRAALRVKIEERDVIANWQDLLDYCRVSFGGRGTEEFHVLYLDTKCKLVKDETHSIGTLNHAGVYPREILKRVLELGAASVIVAHNHPTGDVNPSPADVELTLKIADTLRAADVALHDHIIVSSGAVLSFKAMSLM
ncbi:MAG: DNA repair protein RadC [Rickettsiales bacterium]|jgi:DNA repair protein RadC|nr:DNA repair protein RadC [Rickettsiales bacterium]